MSIEYAKGDILDWVGKVDCIGHQVNCYGVMGGGLALQIASKYPEVLRSYQDFIKDYTYFNKSRRGLLGICQTTSIGGNCWIANLFGQYNTGGGVQTDYNALATALSELEAKMLYIGKYKVALPVNLGCGLAGGDWKVVLPIIQKVFEKSEIELTLVEYKPKEYREI